VGPGEGGFERIKAGAVIPDKKSGSILCVRSAFRHREGGTKNILVLAGRRIESLKLRPERGREILKIERGKI